MLQVIYSGVNISAENLCPEPNIIGIVYEICFVKNFDIDHRPVTLVEGQCEERIN